MIRHFGLRNVGCLWWLFLFVCVFCYSFLDFVVQTTETSVNTLL